MSAILFDVCGKPIISPYTADGMIRAAGCVSYVVNHVGKDGISASRKNTGRHGHRPPGIGYPKEKRRRGS